MTGEQEQECAVLADRIACAAVMLANNLNTGGNPEDTQADLMYIKKMAEKIYFLLKEN